MPVFIGLPTTGIKWMGSFKGWKKYGPPLSSEVRNQMQDLNNTDFSKSDAVLGRTISSLIKIGWTEEQVKERAEKIREAIAAVI